jgi:hypothetical protein
MRISGSDHRAILITGTITYLVLFILAIVYYQERMLFTDMSFHSFSILVHENFAIQNHRFGAFFTQLLPIFSVKAGASLKTFLQLYSVSFILYYYVLFMLCSCWLKQPKFALLILLHSVLMTTDTFYWIQSELQQGIPFLLFLLALCFYKPVFRLYNPFEKIVWIFSVLLLPFFHPLLLVGLLFCLYWLSASGNKFPKGMQWVIVCYYGLAFTGTRYLFPSGGYDETAFAKLNNFRSLFPCYLQQPSVKNFIRWCFFDYHLLIGLLLYLIVIFYRTKSRKSMYIMLFSFFGYTATVLICYPGTVPQFYMENLLLPLSLFVLVPFLFNHAFQIRSRIFWKYLVLFLSIRLFFIALNHTKFTRRINWEKELLIQTEQRPDRKLMVPESIVPAGTTIMNWGLVYELLLLSSLQKNKESRSIFFTENPDDYRWALPGKNTFITQWGIWDYRQLPKKYFRFTDTGSYRIINQLNP